MRLVFLGIIRETLVFGDERDHVHSETVDSLVEPEFHEVIDFAADFRIIPIQIGLLFCEKVKVIFAPGRIFFQADPEKNETQLFGSLPSLSGRQI